MNAVLSEKCEFNFKDIFTRRSCFKTLTS